MIRGLFSVCSPGSGEDDQLTHSSMQRLAEKLAKFEGSPRDSPVRRKSSDPPGINEGGLDEVDQNLIQPQYAKRNLSPIRRKPQVCTEQGRDILLILMLLMSQDL